MHVVTDEALSCPKRGEPLKKPTRASFGEAVGCFIQLQLVSEVHLSVMIRFSAFLVLCTFAGAAFNIGFAQKPLRFSVEMTSVRFRS